jgi:hypothetical protein
MVAETKHMIKVIIIYILSAKNKGCGGAFLKAIADHLLNPAFEINDRSDFG